MNIRLLSFAALLGLTISGCASTLTKEEIAEASSQCKSLYNNKNYTEAHPKNKRNNV